MNEDLKAFKRLFFDYLKRSAKWIPIQLIGIAIASFLSYQGGEFPYQKFYSIIANNLFFIGIGIFLIWLINGFVATVYTWFREAGK
jgi:hypothetical protein